MVRDKRSTSRAGSQESTRGSDENKPLETSIVRRPPIIMNCVDIDTTDEQVLVWHNSCSSWEFTERLSKMFPELIIKFRKFKENLKKIVQLLGGTSMEEESLDELIANHSEYFDEDSREEAKVLLLQRMKDPEDDDIEDVIEDNVLLQKALILQEIYFRKSLQNRQQSVHVFNWTGELSLPFVQIITKNCYSKEANAFLNKIKDKLRPCGCYCAGPCTSCKNFHNRRKSFFCTVTEKNGMKLLLPPDGYFRERDGYYARSCPKKICQKANCLQRIPSCPTTISLGVVHTARRGYALIALEDAPTGTILAEHKGLVYMFDETVTSKRLYSFPRANHNISWDGEEYGTLHRFCNNSCDPTTIMISVLEGGYQGKDQIQRIIVVAKRDIKAGEELTFDYHPRTPMTAKKPTDWDYIDCKCGAKKCRGWF